MARRGHSRRARLKSASGRRTDCFEVRILRSGPSGSRRRRRNLTRGGRSSIRCRRSENGTSGRPPDAGACRAADVGMCSRGSPKWRTVSQRGGYQYVNSGNGAGALGCVWRRMSLTLAPNANQEYDFASPAGTSRGRRLRAQDSRIGLGALQQHCSVRSRDQLPLSESLLSIPAAVDF